MEQPTTTPAGLYEVPLPRTSSTRRLPARPSVHRASLVRRIEDGLTGRLILITAPAGWGKSSLLADWAAHTQERVVMVGCEATRGSALGFLRTLVSAIEEVVPGFGQDLFPMLRGARPLPVPQVFAVLEDAFETRTDDLVVVLDDFHLVTDPEVVEGVFSLMSRGSGRTRFIIASRSTPPWSLARWRAHGEVTEIGIRDLAFTVLETVAMFEGGADRASVAPVLQQRSEGWAAGLRLARAWMDHCDGLSEIEEKFRGNHRDIADYLAEEVVRHLPAETERLLLSVSLLDRFSADLAAAVSGVRDARSIVEDLERQSLFMVPLDHEREWYRLHLVFREFLRTRLEQREHGEIPGVLHRAAHWYREHGYPIEAVECLIRAGEEREAALLLADVAEDLLHRNGETAVFIRLVEQLPMSLVRDLPTLQREYAWALVIVGRLEEAERIAADLESQISELHEHQRRLARAVVASIRSRIAAYRSDHDGTIANATDALTQTDEELDWYRADALLSIGFAYRAKGSLERAAEVFGEASRLGWKTGFANAALWGARYHAVTLVSQGRLRDAGDLIEESIARAERAGMERNFAFAALLIGRGELRYEQNDLAGARADLERALELARTVGDAKILMNSYVALSLLQEAEGHPDRARQTIRRAVAVFDGSGEKATEAWLALRHGDLERVRAWMASYIAQEGDQPSFSCGETEQVMLGRAMIHTGDVDRGVAFLTALLDEAEASGRWGRALPVRTLLAIGARELGDHDAAMEHARRAIDIAAREGHVRTILDEDPAFLQILRQAMRTDRSAARRAYAAQLMSGGVSSEPASGVVPGLMEPLTQRQQEVLSLLADGRSNREIADALYLSEGTVKAHLHQIFGKLMVRNRAEAIQAARRLGAAS